MVGLVGWLVGRLECWLVVWLVCRWAGGSVDRLAGQCAGWLAGWLVGWLVVTWASWLVDSASRVSNEKSSKEEARLLV